MIIPNLSASLPGEHVFEPVGIFEAPRVFVPLVWFGAPAGIRDYLAHADLKLPGFYFTVRHIDHPDGRPRSLLEAYVGESLDTGARYGQHDRAATTDYGRDIELVGLAVCRDRRFGRAQTLMCEDLFTAWLQTQADVVVVNQPGPKRQSAIKDPAVVLFVDQAIKGFVKRGFISPLAVPAAPRGPGAPEPFERMGPRQVPTVDASPIEMHPHRFDAVCDSAEDSVLAVHRMCGGAFSAELPGRPVEHWSQTNQREARLVAGPGLASKQLGVMAAHETATPARSKPAAFPVRAKRGDHRRWALSGDVELPARSRGDHRKDHERFWLNWRGLVSEGIAGGGKFRVLAGSEVVSGNPDVADDGERSAFLANITKRDALRPSIARLTTDVVCSSKSAAMILVTGSPAGARMWKPDLGSPPHREEPTPVDPDRTPPLALAMPV